MSASRCHSRRCQLGALHSQRDRRRGARRLAATVHADGGAGRCGGRHAPHESALFMAFTAYRSPEDPLTPLLLRTHANTVFVPYPVILLITSIRRWTVVCAAV